MNHWKRPTDESIEKVLGSVRKETDRRYFFSQLKNPLWLQPLVERGYFNSPPVSSHLPDGSLQFPSWPELEYLKNVSRDAPEEVTNVVSNLPEVDNPIVYDGILDIALQLPGELSGRLGQKMLEYASLSNQFLPHRYAELLAHWVAEEQAIAALELAGYLVRFFADQDAETKKKRHKRNPEDWTTWLNKPSPRFNEWDYKTILDQGVSPLAEREPYKIALLLIDVVAEMIPLSMHQKELEQIGEEDASAIWCRRLRGPRGRHEECDEAVVATLTYACEKVFENAPDSVAALDAVLRNQRWNLFKRLRHHLYALYPNEQTKPWIREAILEYGYFARREYHYEFQRMIRCSCEHFREELLTEGERKYIYDAMLSGPSKTLYREWTGDRFTEELFEQYQRHFHRKQLRPFASVLLAKYSTYFQGLEDEANSSVSDEDYGPVGEVKSGTVSFRSPQSPGELAERSDEELLAYINEWDAEDNDEGNWLVKTTVEALVETFQTVFRESVLPDAARFRFWLENRERIQRPIYVRAMTRVMQDHIEGGNFGRLHETLGFCEWVLSHSDQEPQRGYWSNDKSRENPNWNRSRRAVADLIEICFNEDVGLPDTVKVDMARLLDTLCTQLDWRLDRSEKVFPDREDSYAEAINNTRSLALQSLIRFGLWMKRDDPQADLSIMTAILEKRFSLTTNVPLSAPEYAMLGVHFAQMLALDETWATGHREDFFPRQRLNDWQAAFDSLLRYTFPNSQTFELLRDDFKLAVQKLTDLEESNNWGENLVVILGEHLYIYYLWGMHPLRGNGSLVEEFYQRTSGNP